jgi:MSHA biogenesis protein MshK
MRRTRASLAIALALAMAGLHAQSAADPMRPPLAEASAAERAAAATPVVQAIVIRPDLRYAVIDGQTVKVGGRIGDMQVTRIDESRVRVAGPSGVTELRLYPHVEKSAAHAAPTAKTARRQADARAARREESRLRLAGEPGVNGALAPTDVNRTALPRRSHGESK